MALDLRRFAPHEFRGWWDRTSPRLLLVIDVFADRWGPAVYVSDHPRAIGREDGPEGTSQHNVDAWGEVRGIDLQPEGLVTRAHALRAMEIARQCGATGIGIYPHWRPIPGIHIDVRTDRTPGDPALWGGILRGDDQDYVSVWDAVGAFPREGGERGGDHRRRDH